MTTPEPTITGALIAAGIDSDTITETPDGVVTVPAADGTRIAVGDDGMDEAGTQRWWTGTWYSAQEDIERTDSWTSLEAMAAAVAATPAA